MKLAEWSGKVAVPVDYLRKKIPVSHSLYQYFKESKEYCFD